LVDYPGAQKDLTATITRFYLGKNEPELVFYSAVHSHASGSVIGDTSFLPRLTHTGTMR